MDELLTFYTSGTYQKENRIGETAKELQSLFKARIPYLEITKTDGLCYEWIEASIKLFRIAMTNESIKGMSREEEDAWFRFVDYEDGVIVYDNDAMEKMDNILINLVDCVPTQSCTQLEEVIFNEC